MKARSLAGSASERLRSERVLWDAGYGLVAGVDEVGRGALAGPLIAAAVVLPTVARGKRLPRALYDVKDSKLLAPAERKRLVPLITDAAEAVGIGMVSVAEIDAYGIAAANRIAMERAVELLPIDPDVLLLDATVTDLGCPQIGLIDGDALCLSIAAASIVAKVTRDDLMHEHHLTDDRYGFHLHKGYGTAAHLSALDRFGPCSIHRQSFAPVARCGATASI